jgi:hypothetical protein
MATVRKAQRGIVLLFCFILSAFRAWPSKLSPSRAIRGAQISQAMMLHLPSLNQQVGRALEFGWHPLTARLVSLPLQPLIASVSPGAFVTRMQTAQAKGQACYDAKSPGAVGELKGCTTTSSPTNPSPTSCTTAPPPVPPPVTTVEGTGDTGVAPGCTRTTINSVCAKVFHTSYCKVKDCCWNNDQVIGCSTLSSYTTRYTYTTYTTYTSYPTCGADRSAQFRTCYY